MIEPDEGNVQGSSTCLLVRMRCTSSLRVGPGYWPSLGTEAMAACVGGVSIKFCMHA